MKVSGASVATEPSINESTAFFDKIFSVGPDGKPCEGVKAYEAQLLTGGKVYAKGKIIKYDPNNLVVPTPGASRLFDSSGYLIAGGVGKTNRKGKK